MDSKRICYICGFNFDSEPPGERQEWPFIFCPCCCFEYGIEEFEYDCYILKRNEWITDGLKFGQDLYPENYIWTFEDVIDQIENLRLVDLKNYPFGLKMNPNYTKYVNINDVIFNWENSRKID